MFFFLIFINEAYFSSAERFVNDRTCGEGTDRCFKMKLDFAKLVLILFWSCCVIDGHRKWIMTPVSVFARPQMRILVILLVVFLQAHRGSSFCALYFFFLVLKNVLFFFYLCCIDKPRPSASDNQRIFCSFFWQHVANTHTHTQVLNKTPPDPLNNRLINSQPASHIGRLGQRVRHSRGVIAL